MREIRSSDLIIFILNLGGLGVERGKVCIWGAMGRHLGKFSMPSLVIVIVMSKAQVVVPRTLGQWGTSPKVPDILTATPEHLRNLQVTFLFSSSWYFWECPGSLLLLPSFHFFL